jgi:perosamine synthetase
MIYLTEPFLKGNEKKYILDCLKTNWISSLGDYIPRFEEAFAGYCGAKFGVATSNGTTALHLALLILGIKSGDEVLVPTLTFVATANAVTYTGAKAVFVDSEPQTGNMDPDKIEKRITPRTKAIMVVHLYGHSAHMGPIQKIAKKHGLYLIEDAAEAHGGLYFPKPSSQGRRVGSLGDIGCFSFYGNKIITTGEGGMIVTNRKEWAEKAKWLRDHGMSQNQKYYHPVIGYNYRLTNLQAALGLAQFEQIDYIIKRKREIASWYKEGLAEIEGITFPKEAPWAFSVYWMFNLFVEDTFGLSRDQLAKELSKAGIETRPLFHPIHLMPPYQYANKNKMPVSVELSRKGLSLPSSPRLKPGEITRICRAIKKIGAGSKRKKKP